MILAHKNVKKIKVKGQLIQKIGGKTDRRTDMTDCNTSPVTTKSSFLSSLVGRHQIPVVTSNPRSISARRRHNYNEKQPHVSTGLAPTARLQ